MDNAPPDRSTVIDSVITGWLSGRHDAKWIR